MRRIVLALVVGIGGWCGGAQAEVYEIPLPEVTGDYVMQFGSGLGTTKEFTVDLGFPLAAIQDVRVRIAGSITAPLAHRWSPGGSAVPVDSYFIIYLRREIGNLTTGASGPSVGESTYPDPEAFSAELSMHPVDWAFLQDGGASGKVSFARPPTYPEISFSGGRGTITAAWLIIDATPVPEVGVSGALGLMVCGLCRRRR